MYLATKRSNHVRSTIIRQLISGIWADNEMLSSFV